jgi:hypothetical protein
MKARILFSCLVLLLLALRAEHPWLGDQDSAGVSKVIRGKEIRLELAGGTIFLGISDSGVGRFKLKSSSGERIEVFVADRARFQVIRSGGASFVVSPSKSGALTVYCGKGRNAAYMGDIGGYTGLSIQNAQGKPVFYLGNDTNDVGLLQVRGKDGKLAFVAGSSNGSGEFKVLRRNGSSLFSVDVAPDLTRRMHLDNPDGKTFASAYCGAKEMVLSIQSPKSKKKATFTISKDRPSVWKTDN